MTPTTTTAPPTLERWVTYESSGFVSMPWRLGSVLGPIAKSETGSATGWQRNSDSYERIIALEVVGSRGVIHALARALRHDEPVTFANANVRTRRSLQTWWASGGLLIFEKRLPSGPTHALLLHPQAVAGELNPHKPVYAIGREEDPTHAYRILNAALPIPLLPAWTPWLLETGERLELIFRLKSENLWGIEIAPNLPAWAALVHEGLTSGALRWNS